MKTRAVTTHTSIMQRWGRCCVGTVLPWLLALSLSGCVGTQSAAPVRQGDSQERPVTERDKQLQDIDQRVEQTEKNNRAAMAELQRRLAAQEAEVRALHGNLEVVQHENKVLKDQVKEKAVTEADMDRPTFAQIEQPAPVQAGVVPSTGGPVPVAKPGAPPAAGVPVVPGTAVPGGTATPPAVTAMPPAAPLPGAAVPGAVPAGKPGVAAVTPAPSGAAPAAKSGAATPAGTPQQMYDAALLLLRSGQYNASREGFEKFLEKYPNDTLSDHAQYWIGELYSVQKQYREALVAFNQVLTRWPTSDKVPPCLLKIGFAFYELGDMANARASLTKLVNDYPDFSQMAMARQRLQEIAQKEKESGKGGTAAAESGKADAKPETPGSKRVKRLTGE